MPSSRVGKMVESLGKVSEKSGNLETIIEWQPRVGSIYIIIILEDFENASPRLNHLFLTH